MNLPFIKLNSKKKGQALLIVVVISTLALLILLSMADRISLTRVNVQRSAEFDKSITTAENKLNDLIKVLDQKDTNTQACLGTIGPSDTSYKEITCSQLQNTFQNTKIYGRLSPDGFISVNNSLPLTLVLGTSLTQGKPTTGIVARCEGSTSAKYMITRVYYDASGTLFVDKGVFTCISGTVTPSCQGNVDLYDARSGTPAKVAGTGAPLTTRQNTILIRAKLLDEAGSQNVKLDLKAYGNAPSCSIQAGTSKYEFLVVGLGGVDQGTGGLGSDAVFSFEKPKDDTSAWASSLFDYAYLGEDQ